MPDKDLADVPTDSDKDSDKPTDEDEVSDEPVPVPVPVFAFEKEPVAVVGIRDVGLATTGKAKCYCCKALIEKGDVRFQYRSRATRSFEHLHYGHSGCVHNLPPVSRERDRAFLEWKSKRLDAHPEKARDVVKAIQDVFQA